MNMPDPVKPDSLFLSIPGRAAWLCLFVILAGCAGPGEVRQEGPVADAGKGGASAEAQGADEKDKVRSEEHASDSISFYENRSIDRAVREDFEQALVLLRKQKYPEAIKLLQKITQKTQNSAPYVNIALAYEITGELGPAEDALKRALALNPDHPVTMNEYALLYRRSGRFAEARTLYERLLVKHPSFLPARKNLGILCELYLNDLRCAREQYEAYMAARPDDEEVKLWIIGLKQKTGG